MRERSDCHLRVAVNATATHGRVQPFVRIERHRVGAFNAGKQVLRRGCERRERAVGAIDVQPQRLRSAISARSSSGSKPRVRRSGIGDNAHWPEAGFTVGVDPALQFGEVDPQRGIRRDGLHVFRADAE